MVDNALTDGDDIIPTDVSAIMVAGTTGTNGHEGGRSDARCLIPSLLPVGWNRDSASLWQGRVLIRSMTVRDGAI